MSNQLQLILVELPDGSHQLTMTLPTGIFPMTVDNVSELIAGLSIERARMKPAIPMSAPPIANMQHVADDPPIRWAYDEINDRTALLIRHPGHGWIGSSLPMEVAQDLIAGLQQISDHRNKQRQMPN